MSYPRFYTLRIGVDPVRGTLTRYLSNGTVHHDVGSANRYGYLTININRTPRLNHKVIWEHVNGPVPDGFEIDHINGQPSDNRIENLRLVTHRQNNENIHEAHCDSRSGVKGVHWYTAGNKWTSSIMSNGRKFHLGYFTTIEDAQRAYAGAAALLHTHNPHAAP